MSKTNERVTSVPFHGFVTIVTASNVQSLGLNPTLFANSRLANIAKQFQNYRIRSYKFRGLPLTVTSPATAGGVWSGYVAGQSVPPTAYTDFEGRTTHFFNTAYTNSTPFVRCTKDELKGQFPWYKTDPSATVDANEEEVGTIRIFSSATAVTFQMEVIAVYEFKDPVDDLLGLRTDTLERERSKLKKILGIPEGSDILLVPKSKTLEDRGSTASPLVKKN